MLRLNNITKQYADGRGIRRVLDELDLEVNDGEFIAITGESGSGKTTLLSILGTILAPDDGTYILGDTEITQATDRLSMIRNSKIGMVFQDHRLLPQLTAIQNILLPLLAEKDTVSEEAVGRAEELMELVGITPLRDKYVDTLSGGEKTRVAICRALINKPLLLLADEPTGQLDADNAHLVADLFRKINTSLHTTIVMVTHSEEMATVADRCYELVEGNLCEKIRF